MRQQFSLLLLLMFIVWLQLAFSLKTFIEILWNAWHHLLILLACCLLNNGPTSHEHPNILFVFTDWLLLLMSLLVVPHLSLAIPFLSLLARTVSLRTVHLFWSFCLTFSWRTFFPFHWRTFSYASWCLVCLTLLLH